MTNKELLDRAHEIRKFEIDLYWRRSAYFWAFIALAFVGYGTLQVNGDKNNLSFLLCNVGFVASYAWFLVNKGGKYWQEVWEGQVDRLEGCGKNRLYKVVIARVRKEDTWRNRIKERVSGAPKLPSNDDSPMCLSVPSVSNINQLGSAYVMSVWLLLGSRSRPLTIDFWKIEEWAKVDRYTTLFVVLTVVIVILFRIWGWTKSGNYDYRKQYRKAECCDCDCCRCRKEQ